MDTPQFTDGQFVNGSLLNGAFASAIANEKANSNEMHYPGLYNPSSLVFTPSSLVVQIQAPSPFAVLFGSGSLAGAHGTTAGADTSTYSLNMASFVPGSGSQTVYILAEYTQIGENLVQVVGPPPGHPDYDATFNPFSFYTTQRDSLSIVGSTAPADNVTSFELARITLSAGQNTITSGEIDTTHWHYASAVLSPTGVTAGTYAGATITVDQYGRLTAASAVAYGPLAAANDWTAVNTFNDPGSFEGGIVIQGSVNGYGAGMLLKGDGSTTPNKFIHVAGGALYIVNSALSNNILVLNDAGTLNVAGQLSADVSAQGIAGNSVAPLMSDFGSSVAASGYQRFPSGLIIQWGRTGAIITANSSETDTLPIAFPHAFLQAYATPFVSAGTGHVQGASAFTQSLSSITVTNTSTTDQFYIQWLAIGY